MVPVPVSKPSFVKGFLGPRPRQVTAVTLLVSKDEGPDHAGRFGLFVYPLILVNDESCFVAAYETRTEWLLL
jgi:hypothetical protein